jgi:hypothetical protein
MPAVQETVSTIVAAQTWDQRVAQIRLIPQNHGLGEQPQILAAVARQLYVPHLAPDYAYIHESSFYELPFFQAAYEAAVQATGKFTRVDADDLAQALKADPRTLLVLRTIVGFTKDELAHSTQLVAERLGLAGISGAKVDSMERKGSASSDDVCRVVAETLAQVMAGTLFGDPPGELKPKQAKPDTAGGWTTVAHLAAEGVPYSMLLHRRHYGGAFRQVLDATSTARGNLIEDAVEVLFKENGVPYIRTGSHNQGDIAARFEVRVTPAPDFVVFDLADRLQGMLECKGASDGGTARAALWTRTHRMRGVSGVAGSTKPVRRAGSRTR